MHKRIVSALFLFMVVFILFSCVSCSTNNSAESNLATSKSITAFSFISPAATGIINESAKTISVAVPYGTDLTALVATFATTGMSVNVGPDMQVSGVTPNNFTDSVDYVVTAADGTTAIYIVAVTISSPLPGVDWTTVHDASPPLYSVAWSGTLFAAAGGQGIITSRDGIAWKNAATSGIYTLSGIVWSGSQFVAVGSYGTIITSPDGIAWTTRRE